MKHRSTIAITALTLLFGAAFASTYTFAPDSAVARYRVREQLAGVSFPNDAVGITRNVQGRVQIDDDGLVGPDALIVVDVASLASDQARRDGFVHRETLQKGAHPTVEFLLRSIEGLTLPLPTEGAAELVLHGELTIRGVTRPATWTATLAYGAEGAHLQASTTFTFADFDLTKPRVASVLSVADEITLELEGLVVEVP